MICDIKNNNNAFVLQLFHEKLKEISIVAKDRNTPNYSNLDYTKYDCFTVLLEKQNILCFSGLQSFGFPNEICRALSRTFYSYNQRITTTVAGHPGLAMTYMLPYQIDYARQIKKKAIFVSMEFPRRRSMLNRLAIQYTLTTGYQWEVLDNMYKTCSADVDTCWQNIAICKFVKDYELTLPSISVDKWNEKFNVV